MEEEEAVEVVVDDDEGSDVDDDNDDVDDKSIILRLDEAGTFGMLSREVTSCAAVEMLVRLEFQNCGVRAAYVDGNIADPHFLFGVLHLLFEGSHEKQASNHSS